MVFDGYMAQRLAQYDSDYDFKKNAFLDELACATLSGSLYPVGVSDERPDDSSPDDLLQRRTAELWEGLRRVYFGELEAESDGFLFDQPSAKKRRLREAEAEYKRELVNTMHLLRLPIQFAYFAVRIDMVPIWYYDWYFQASLLRALESRGGS